MPDRPDLVLIMTDQQRFDQVGYASDGFYETPNIDALARRGVAFDNAYSGSTTCVPARVSLLTGLQHHRVPIQVNRFALREGFWTVAHALRQAGYQTALIGKMHFAPIHAQHGFDVMRLCEHLTPNDFRPDDGEKTEEYDDYHDALLARGLDDWRARPAKVAREQRELGRTTLFPYDAALHPTSWVEQEAVSLLENRDRDRPLFLVVSFPHPHKPHNPPEPYASMYDPADTVLPGDGFGVNDDLPIQFSVAMNQKRGRFHPRRVDENEAEARNLLTAVRALVRQIDDSVGRIVETLDMERSVLFFTSDHGDYGGHRGLLSKVPWIPFDDLARVPLVVAGQGVVGDGRVSSPVQSCDFALSCLDYAGVEAPGEGPEEFDTRSLRPMLENRSATTDLERTVFCGTTTGWPMVRRGPLKYMTTNEDRSAGVLFDLEADPGETIDLRRDAGYRSDVESLSAALAAELARTRPDLPDFGSQGVKAGSSGTA